MARIEKDVRVMDHEIDDIKQVLAAHNVRFENGRNALEDLRKTVEALKPEPTDWVRVGLAFLTIVSVLMGAQIWIQSNFETRPTRGEIEAQIAPLESKTDRVGQEIRSLKQGQAVQGEVIQRIEKTQEATMQKLNTLLRRVR